jgi:type IV fimbrial biogenesis protein FimT
VLSHYARHVSLKVRQVRPTRIEDSMTQMIDHFRPRSSSGFTIVELLITIAVAGILLGIAVPSFTAMTVNSRLTTQTHDLIAAVNLARSEAIKRNGSVSLCRVDKPSATACATSNRDWEHWAVRASNGTIVRRGRVNTYGGTLAVRSTLIDDRADFGADGLVRTDGALATDREFSVCATNVKHANIKQVILGAGSRITTETTSGEC